MAKQPKQTPPPRSRSQVKKEAEKQNVTTVSKPNPIVSALERNDWIYILGVALLGFVLYFSTTSFNYTFDDDIYTLKNKYALRGTADMGSIWGYGTIQGFTVAPNNSGIYRPFTLTTFAVENQFFGELKPQNSHFINVLLYALTLGFLCSLLIKLFRNLDLPVYIPVLITVLYALHPLHVEVVASVKSRDEILAMLLPLVAFNALWSFWRDQQWAWLALACVAFFFGICSKENPLTLIFVLPMTLFLFGKQSWQQAFLKSLPIIAVSFLYLIIRFKVLDKDNSSGVNMIANNIVWGAKGAEVLSTNLSVWLEYIRLCLFPNPLSYDYSYNQIPIATWSQLRTYVSLLVHVCLFGLGIWWTLKRNVLGYGLLFYFFTFSIFSNLIPKFVLASTLAERFMFMPSLGWCIALVVGLYYILQKFQIPQSQYISIGVFSFIALVFGFWTYQRTPIWESNAKLFESGLSTSPNSFRVHYNMAETERVAGETLKKEGETTKNPQKIEEGKAKLRKAAKHYEDSFKIYDKESGPWYNLGVCYLNTGDTLKAEQAYKRSLELNQLNGMAANNLGVMQFWKKDYKKAAEYFEIAVKGNNPELMNAYANLGAAYHNMQNLPKAIENYEKAMQMGGSPVVVNNLINIYTFLKDDAKVAQYQAMLKK